VRDAVNMFRVVSLIASAAAVLAAGNPPAPGTSALRLGGVVIGCCFIIELTFLNGRERLAKYDLHALIEY